MCWKKQCTALAPPPLFVRVLPPLGFDVSFRYKAGGIADCNYHDFHKISWTRAARTDKGVHATGNVVSFKMLAPCVELDDGSAVRIAARLCH